MPSALTVLGSTTVELDHQICGADCKRARRFQLMNFAYNKQSAIDVIFGIDAKEKLTDLDKWRRGARRKFRQMEQRLEPTLNLTGAYRLTRLFEFWLPLPWKRYRFTFVINVMRTFLPVQLHEEDMTLRKIIRRKNSTDEVQAYTLLMSTSSTTPRPYLHPCSLSQWAHKAGSFLSNMLALQACTYEEDVMAGGDPIENPWKPGAKQGNCRPIKFGFERLGTLKPTSCRASSGYSYSETCRSWHECSDRQTS